MNLERPLFVNLPRAMEAFSSYPGNSLDRQVFADIAQFANRYGVSFTTEKAIAKRLGRRREEISKSVNRLKEKGFLTITQAKKGLDRHPRNVYRIAPQFLRRHPDKQSPHYNEAAWRRWCEIGRKRAATIALRKKQAAQAAARTVRDTAARMAGGKRPATAKTSQPVPLTPSQASAARQQRGGGFAGFGSVLSGLFPAASATVQPVKDDYSQQVPRGGWSQALREHEAAAAMASQQTQAAAPMSAAQPVPPIQQPPTQPTASEQRERKAQAYEELQSLRERLRQQGTASSQAPADGTARAVQDVARDYRRASRPAVMASPWPASRTAGQPLIQQPQAPADMQHEAVSAWLAGLEATRRQAARDAAKMASQRADYAANPWPAQPVPAVQ